MARIAIAVALALSLSPLAHAHDGSTRGAGPEVLFGGIVQERDVSLFFDYLRDALRAGVEGREPPPPSDELTRRAEAAGEEVKRRGAAAAHALIDAIERSVRESVREPGRLPPSRSSQRI